MTKMIQLKDAVKSILPKPLVKTVQNLRYEASIRRLRGLDFHLNFPDRFILEDIIIPYFVNRSEFHKILFVGCEWYTKPYKKYFKNKEYWTIEIEPQKAKYGSKQHHITDALQNLSLHVAENYFDLIIFTGVFGHGINRKEDTEQAFAQCFQCLRAGGILVFGWDDKPEYKPFPVLEECENLKKFAPYFFPPLATANYIVKDCPFGHRFDFYIKPN